MTAPSFLPFAPEWGHSPVQLEARPGVHVRGLVVHLVPATEIVGHVVDAERRPVAGAEVRLLGVAGEATLVSIPDRFTSDAAGEFRVPARGDEPELVLVVNALGEIVGYCAGNDLSSRDIEGENPLYLPQAKIEGGPTRFWTPDDVARAKRGGYDFVVFDRAKLAQDYPSAEQLVTALAPEYHLKWVIKHRRTKEPIAWVLAPGP